MPSSIRSLYAAFLALVFVAFAATAEAKVSSNDRTDPLPKRLQGIDVVEKLGQKVPEDLGFRDESGKPVTLADYLHADVPVVLTFNYSNCPMLCSLQLNGLVSGLKQLDFDVGKQFRIVTVLLDPKETPVTAHRTKARYGAQYGRPGSESGWHFLSGSEQNIRALAASVGFSYSYNEKRDEYVHPAAITLLAPDGTIARYLYGIEYPEKTLRLGLVEASAGRIGSSIDRLILYCFHYDSEEGRYAPVAARIMRVGGAVTVALLAGFLMILFRRDKKRHLLESTAQ